MTMTTWLTGNDLSLTFDGTGRLWQFRPTPSSHETQPVAFQTDDGIAVAVKVPGVRPGDFDVNAHEDVLEIRGTSAATSDLAWDVALPLCVDPGAMKTSYYTAGFEVRLPMTGAATMPCAEPLPVAV